MYDYVHGNLSGVKAHLDQVERGTKLWDHYFVPRLKTKDKNQKLVRFGANLYVAEDIGLVAFTQVDYKILIFGKTTRACVYRIADLRNYKYEEQMVRNGDKTEKKSTVRMVFINTAGMNAFNLEVNNFKEYFLSHGEPVGENPSPGNKAGGISTLEDKALGCTQKCGKAPVSGVLEYGDRLQTNGLNLLSAPGNDLVASTALASAGCQIVLFTTGRGTPFGTFVPTMKIATNPTLAQRKPNWIDFSAGQLIEGKTMEQLLPEFIDKILAVASGEKARNEANGYREISIFKNGVTL